MLPSARSSGQISRLRHLAGQFQERFHQTHHHASHWLGQRSLSVPDLRRKSQQALMATSLAGSMMIAQGGSSVDSQLAEQVQALEADSKDNLLGTITKDEHQAIIEKMIGMVTRPAGHLDKQDELYLEQQLTDMLDFPVAAELEGQRLNHSVGIMGGEQHLRRFPSDTLDQHDAYQEAGLAPDRGAYGWFTEQGELTGSAIQREKYYFAVQTLYLSNWNRDHLHLKEWYKWRKMIVINPHDRTAVVGVVGDAGPALWVNKQFGGSPEVIREGAIWSKQARGRVLLLFVDDPQDKIPLGVIKLDYDQLTKLPTGSQK
ncbi:MAG: hypothetical protein COU69_00395 [Candidatus Pacebacteria bacterium CG10_big_fil_rev_8_21_14_0_10_56_10]|nr:MAG: hypothetical protein COU69_00395 [Candidatus Pacebacteria bacterium CG10_big_fil_rev_8_21_14_0_10_56_10]